MTEGREALNKALRLVREDPKLFLKENVGASLNEKGVIDAQKNLDTLINYQRVSSKDTVKNLNSGMISSKLIKHDVYHKRLDLYKYNYLDNFDRDIHPDNGEATPIISTAKDPDTNKSLIDPIAGNVTGKGTRNSGDTIGSIEYGRERGYLEEKNK